MLTTNGPESNLYGLEPNFGCCTANMHQGWPKFAAHLWMKTPDEGIVAAAYAPSRAEFRSRGTPVVGLARHRLPVPGDADAHGTADRAPRASRWCCASPPGPTGRDGAVAGGPTSSR